MADSDTDEHRLALERGDDGTLIVHLYGHWTFQEGLPDIHPVHEAIEDRPPARLAYDASDLRGWNSGLLTVLVEVEEVCKAKGIEVDASGLPEGVSKLVALATAVPERQATATPAKPPPFLERLGERWLGRYRGAETAIDFIGEAVLSFGRMFIGRANFRRSDLVLYIHQCGAEALPIVALISMLIGSSVVP